VIEAASLRSPGRSSSPFSHWYRGTAIGTGDLVSWEAVLQAEEEGSPLARPWRCVPVVCSPEWLLSETPVRVASGGPDGFRISFHRRRRIRALVPISAALAAFLCLLIVNDNLGAPLHTTYISRATCLTAAGALAFVAGALAFVGCDRKGDLGTLRSLGGHAGGVLAVREKLAVHRSEDADQDCRATG
jgi:hypothetical protein